MSISAQETHALLHNEARNNDSLAPVYTLLRNERGAELTEGQIWAEYVTDMSERATEEPFLSPFSYKWVEGRYLANTGEDLNLLLAEGVRAARHDALTDPEMKVGVDLALAYQAHPEIIRQWEIGSDQRPLLLASLCHSTAEMDARVAKKLSRKQNRLMASMWVFEKTASGIIDVRAFSLDNLRLKDLDDMRNAGVIDGIVEETVTDQIRKPMLVNDVLSADDAVKLLHGYHDKKLRIATGNEHHFGISTQAKVTANEIINAKPEAYQLYRNIVSEVAASLLQLRPTAGLKGYAAYLADPFSFDQVPKALQLSADFTEDDGRRLMDYLRSRALPHYLFNKDLIGASIVSSDSDSLGIAEAGAEAVERGLEYDGACPTSETIAGMQANQTVAEIYKVKGNVEYLECVTCPFCNKSVTAKVVHSSNTIECLRPSCRAKLNTKTGKRVDVEFLKLNKSLTLAELLVKFFFGDEAEDKEKPSKIKKT